VEKTQKKLKGFTLLEVLIATSMFVVVLIITIGTVGFGAGFQGRIGQQKRVTDETSRISDLIERDIRGANAEIKVAAGAQTYTFDHGLAEFVCIESCSLKNNNVASVELTNVDIADAANALVISANDSYKIYLSEGNKDKVAVVYYKEIKKSLFKDDVLSGNDIIMIRKSENQISSTKLETSIYFAGLASSMSGSTAQQDFVQFYIVSRSLDYNNAKVQNRAKSELRSIITSRRYN